MVNGIHNGVNGKHLLIQTIYVCIFLQAFEGTHSTQKRNSDVVNVMHWVNELGKKYLNCLSLFSFVWYIPEGGNNLVPEMALPLPSLSVCGPVCLSDSDTNLTGFVVLVERRERLSCFPSFSYFGTTEHLQRNIGPICCYRSQTLHHVNINPVEFSFSPSATISSVF
jgi:hypothetical protein